MKMLLLDVENRKVKMVETTGLTTITNSSAVIMSISFTAG